MKKILSLLLIVTGLWACSTDNEEDLVQYEKNLVKEFSAPTTILSVQGSCFSSLTGSVHVDVSGGFNNPIVVFTPTAAGSLTGKLRFKMRLEVQPLSNCDDMNSNTGNVLNFNYTFPTTSPVLTAPSISVAPSSLPLCYKWRFVFEGFSGTQTDPSCSSVSVWYESPLF